MQKKIEHLPIKVNSGVQIGKEFPILPGKPLILTVEHLEYADVTYLTLHAEQAFGPDSEANVYRTFHVYESGEIVKEGHIHVASTKADDGTVYHLYEDLGVEPKCDRILNLRPAEELSEVVAEEKDYTYTTTLKTYYGDKVIFKDLDLSKDTLGEMLNNLCGVKSEALEDFFGLVDDRRCGVAVSPETMIPKYRILVTEVTED